MSRIFRQMQFAALLTISSVYCENSEAEDPIIVNKKGGVYKFSRSDKQNEDFAIHEFPRWENETFDVFDKVKDDQGIAIDIGAWIGTTAIWLANHFHHVIAIEADPESLKSMRANLKASACTNVTLCPYPVADKREQIIFGPRGARLNESISYIKKQSDNPLDFVVKSLTFKQILYDYVYSNILFDSYKISFIKCDIEGGEEEILEDVLHFAYNNSVPVYMSFHLDWWKSKKIDDFEYLLKYFSNNYSSEDICAYIRANPFCSILLEPKKDDDVLIKKNIPAVIIGYNLFSCIKNMVSQLERYTDDIIIVDNNSDYEPLLDYYKNEYRHTLVRFRANLGFAASQRDSVQKLVGDLYILTDPDLQFNSCLPDHFIQDLISISNHFEANKVGFALLFDADDIRSDITCYGQSVESWESVFWQNRLLYPHDPTLELYQAPLDTTFCLVNRRFKNASIRVAGDYLCKHLPWHTNFYAFLLDGEYEYYLERNNSTHWVIPK